MPSLFPQKRALFSKLKVRGFFSTAIFDYYANYSLSVHCYLFSKTFVCWYFCSIISQLGGPITDFTYRECGIFRVLKILVVLCISQRFSAYAEIFRYSFVRISIPRSSWYFSNIVAGDYFLSEVMANSFLLCGMTSTAVISLTIKLFLSILKQPFSHWFLHSVAPAGQHS